VPLRAGSTKLAATPTKAAEDGKSYQLYRWLHLLDRGQSRPAMLRARATPVHDSEVAEACFDTLAAREPSEITATRQT